ncbi:MAG: hypothetical protein FJ297_13815 [Planctomycetes bacterium]|nr:hypothetical protein [Planctomycetota bacterium]
MGMRLVVPPFDWPGPLTVAEWLLDDGDWVNAGRPICVVATPLCQTPLYAMASGFLRCAKPRCEPGTRVERFALLAEIVSPGDSERAEAPRPIPDRRAFPVRTAFDASRLRDAARRANPTRRLATPRARAAMRGRRIGATGIEGEPADDRITAPSVLGGRIPDSAFREPSTGAAPTFGRITAALRWEVDSPEDHANVLARVRADMIQRLSQWHERSPVFRIGALGRPTRDGVEYRELRPEVPVEGPWRNDLPRATDFVYMDLTDVRWSALELPELDAARCLIQLGGLTYFRSGQRVVVQCPVSIRFDARRVAFADIAALMDALPAAG